MNDLIQAELKSVLSDWKAGRTVKSIVLGHPVRQVTDRDGALVEERHVFRQKAAHECAFQIIEICLVEPTTENFELFHDIAKEKARELHLSAEEEGAAISFAWAVLLRGWKRALHGFDDVHSIDIHRETNA